jgi:hypothetical protein
VLTTNEMGSERSFGLVFTAFFALLGGYSFFYLGEQAGLYFFAVAGIFLLAAVITPGVLRPLNRLWFKFGLMLHKMISPLVMGLLFFVTVTPIALLMRLSGKDPLRLRKVTDAQSYWIQRDPPGPKPQSFTKQF